MALQDGLLSFAIKETIFLSSDKAGIGELKELELVPDVEVLENQSYISITGCLHLTGKYEPIRETAEANSGGTETLIEAMTFAPFQREGAESVAYGWEERISHRIPLNITIPLERVTDASDIFAIVDSFDYKLESPHQMLIEAELRLGGIQFSDLTEAEESSQTSYTAERQNAEASPSYAEDWAFAHVAGDAEDSTDPPATLEEIEQKLSRLEAEFAQRSAYEQQSEYEQQLEYEQQSEYEGQPTGYEDGTEDGQEADVAQQSDYQQQPAFALQEQSTQGLEGWPAAGRDSETEDLFNTPALPAHAHLEQRFGELTEEWEQDPVLARSDLFDREAINADSPNPWTEEPFTVEEAERVVAIHDTESRVVGFTAGQDADENLAESGAQEDEAEEYVQEDEPRHIEREEVHPASAQESAQLEDTEEVSASWPQAEESREVIARSLPEEVSQDAGQEENQHDDSALEVMEATNAAADEELADEPEAVETAGEQAEVKVSISGKSSGAAEGRLNITSIFSQASKARQEAEELLEQSSSSSSARKGTTEAISASTLEAMQNLTSFVRNREERTSQLKLCIIQREETLEQISLRYSLPMSKLMEVNRLTSTDQLVAGQILYIPQ